MNLQRNRADIYLYLKQHNVVKDILNNTDDFYDEPHLFIYQSIFNDLVKPELVDSGFVMDTAGMVASGISYSDSKKALFKCLMETIERFCLFTYLEENIYIKEFSQIKQTALDPHIFINKKSIKNQKFAWIKGHNITQNKDTLLPAQLMFINYHLHERHGEPILGQYISTGAASGFIHEDILLRGIYEVIERDSTMSTFLTQTSPFPIDITTTSKAIQQISQYLHRYWLTPYVFYVMNDFGIPTVLTVLVDSSKLGPEVAVGCKSGLRIEEVIMGSIEEAVMTRHSMRKMLSNSSSARIQTIKFEEIISIEKRALFWSQKGVKQLLQFLFNSNQTISVKDIPQIKKATGIKKELGLVLNAIEKNGYEVYFADITLPQIKKKLGVSVYKVLIPHLQPLFLDEQHKEYQIDRLKKHASLYHMRKIILNPIPHPFL